MPASQNEIKNIIVDHIREAYFPGEPDMPADDTPLLSDGIIDSVNVMLLVDFLETTFGFEFEPHEVDPDNLEDVERMVRFVAKRTA